MIHIDGSSDGTDSIPGVETTPIIIATIVPLSCVVSFVIGVLVGAVVHYCTVRKKRAVALSDDLNQPMEQSNALYEDVTDFQNPENIGVNENAAYNLRTIAGGEDTQSQNDDTLSYYCN